MSWEVLCTGTPTAITGLMTGRRYTIQNSGGYMSGDEAVRLAIVSNPATIDRDTSGFVLLYGAGGVYSIDAGEAVYIWHRPGRNFHVTIEKAG